MSRMGCNAKQDTRFQLSFFQEISNYGHHIRLQLCGHKEKIFQLKDFQSYVTLCSFYRFAINQTNSSTQLNCEKQSGHERVQ